MLEKKAETVKNMQIDIRTPFQKTFFERKFASKEVDVIIINAKPVSYGLCFIRSWQAECKVLTSLNKRTSVTEALFGTKMCKKYFVKDKKFQILGSKSCQICQNHVELATFDHSKRIRRIYLTWYCMTWFIVFTT